MRRAPVPASSSDEARAALAAVRVMLVTDASYDDAALVACAAAASAALGPAFAVQLRDKVRPDPDLVPLAVALRRATAAAGALFFVNGRPDLARSVGADGVHAGAGGPPIAALRAAWPQALLTAPSHSDDELRAALAAGADGALVSPLFVTPGKGPPRGVEALGAARALAGPDVPLFGLGGVSRANAAGLGRAGATGVAVVRALLAAKNPAEEALALRDALAHPC
jgi:thiamine-phosphate pyrophosphorylase